MRKLFALLITIALLLSATALVACTSETTDETTTTTTTTTKATTTTTTTTTKADEGNTPNPDEGNTPNPDEGNTDSFEGVEIANAEELAAFAAGINDGSIAVNTDAKLTADIDMTGYSNVSTWKPMYVYSGIFDGNGFAIKNLNWTFVMENSANGNMNQATDPGTFVITNTDNAKGDNSFADAGVALLVINLDGGSLKNVTLKDSSLTINCSFNKNYNTAVAGLVAYTDGGSIEGCTADNVSVTVPAHVNYNQGAQGYAALIVARATGEVLITDCAAGGALSTEANVKFNAAPILGEFFGEGSLELTGCTSTATVTVCPAENLKTDVLMWKNGENLLGGRTGELYVDSSVETA